MISNIERVGKGLDILKSGLAPLVLRELMGFYKDRWWISGVESLLEGAVGRKGLTSSGAPEERFDRLDIQAQLVIMWENWNNVFRDQIGHTGRSYVSELCEVRNRWAHSSPLAPTTLTAPSTR